MKQTLGSRFSETIATRDTPVHASLATTPHAPTPENARSSPKILLYSHDTVGLGNIRRTLLLAQELRAQYPHATILIVTGSPMVHAFRIPERIDYIKLPCLDRVDADRYLPRFLSECSGEVMRTREAILSKAVVGFEPDLMIVDKRPAGIDGELLDALTTLRQTGRNTSIVLGVRDILDEPARTRRSLRKSKFFETIEQFYDEVWIYGAREIFDPLAEYGFPEAVASKCRFCGYLKRPAPVEPPPEHRSHVLVTPGGGGDGIEMIASYLEGLAGLPRRLALTSTVVFGPEMDASDRAVIRERFGFLTDISFFDFESDLSSRLADADVVVSMAGYNTVCELLSFQKRAVLVPRSKPVMEQLVRARIFAKLGRFELVEPTELNPDRLIAKVLSLLQAPPAATDVDLEGLPRIRRRVRALLSARS